MPELPETETIARQLAAQITGFTLGKVAVSRRDILHGDPRPIERLLPRRRVQRVYRRAKRIILELDPPGQLIFHLGMSGRLQIAPVASTAEPHTHLRIRVNPSRGATASPRLELRFCDPRRFGGVWLLTGHGEEVGRRLGPLGPEPLELAPAAFLAILQRRRMIKGLLLDQAILAGLGNIYCDESLHKAGLHPTTSAASVDIDTGRLLLRSIKATLRKAIRFNGTTFLRYQGANGEPGVFERYCRVYGRETLPCRTCGDEIQRIIVVGRSSFICPTCQPG